MSTLTEADVEQAALDWLASLGWGVAHGPDIGPDAPGAERADYGQAVLEHRLRDALALLNPSLPGDALDDAYRRLTRPEGSTLEARNRAFHRMLVEGVTVEHRDGEGRIRGAQVAVVDFDSPDRNDWLAVNQLTVTENRTTRRPDVVLFVNGLPLGIIEEPCCVTCPSLHKGRGSSSRCSIQSPRLGAQPLLGAWSHTCRPFPTPRGGSRPRAGSRLANRLQFGTCPK